MSRPFSDAENTQGQHGRVLPLDLPRRDNRQLGKTERFVDEQNRVEIRLLRKEGDGCRIRVKSERR